MWIAAIADEAQACMLIDPIAFSRRPDESVRYSQTSNFVCCCNGGRRSPMETVLDSLFFE
jgi:hypothetical protein